MSPICPEAPSGWICIKFDIQGPLADVINCAEFLSIVSGYWFCRGLKFAYPHTNWRSPLTLPELPFRLWCVVQHHSLNSYGDRQISTPYKINAPEPIDKTFGTVDYVRERTPYTTFGTNPPTEGLWANGWNNNKNYFLFILFLSGTRTGQTRGRIFTRDSSKDVKSRRDVPFGVWTMCP